MPQYKSPNWTLAMLAGAWISALVTGPVHAQCMPANPSFEIPGPPGRVFGGWNQFGPVGRAPSATHGSAAARVSGPNAGGFDVAAFWQAVEALPGQRWAATVLVQVSSTSPLAGQSKAIVNVEWRNASGVLISYESHPVADPATVPGEWKQVHIETAAAPAGTVSARLLLGVLQGPGDPVPQVYYDAATFWNLGPPTIESQQWNDFPSGRTISFSGRNWRVKGTGFYGPGPNLFDHSTSAVWVDTESRLHLTIRKIGSSWYSSEVALTDPLGYGDYQFTTRGRVDQLDLNTILGLFLWEYGPCYNTAYLWWNPYNEIDVEFSRWGAASGPNAQFVAQPASTGGNILHYNVTYAVGEVATHAMRWLPDRVEYRSWRGGTQDESPANMVASWVYTGPNLPRPDQPRVHVNLWQIASPAVTQEVVLDAFTFVPACPGGNCGALDAPPVVAPALLAAPASPNPFRAVTRIRYAATGAGRAGLSVLDPAGRIVRRLEAAQVAAGANEFHWDGRDDDGRRVAPGVYFYRLEAPGLARGGRVVVLE